MYQGSLSVVSNREDWIVQSPLLDEDNNEIDLTQATLEVFVSSEGHPQRPLLQGSTLDGKITLPTATSFQWWFTPEDMKSLCIGSYDVYFRATIEGITTQVLACTVPIVEGGPQ